jgi:hypothetical protein
MPDCGQNEREGGFPTKNIRLILMVAFIFLLAMGTAAAGGPFGPLQPVIKGAEGLHTGVGYWFHEDRYQNGADLLIRQNQIYSELGYGSQKGWEVYGRIGVSDLNGIDAFRSADVSMTATKNDFQEGWKFFGTLGAKGFYPFSKTFGMGAFVQGSYSFSDFTDNVSGTRGGTPFLLELRIKNLWDVNAGIGFQATLPCGTMIFAGPYVRYSELKVSPSAGVAGVALASGETTMKNKTGLGGFTGIEVPLAKGFRLNLEGQYTERLSVGAAVIYVY